MKLITAIIKPQQVDNVKEDLNKLGVRGLTATDVKGFGRQKGHTEFYRGSEFEVAFLPKTKLEVAVAEEKLEEVISTIKNSAKTGNFGEYNWDNDTAVQNLSITVGMDYCVLNF